jgi:glucosamine-phosphate N-acetyltransferase
MSSEAGEASIACSSVVIPSTSPPPSVTQYFESIAIFTFTFIFSSLPSPSLYPSNIRPPARMAIISLQRPQTRDRVTSQSRFIRAITNPDELLAELLPPPKKRDPNAKRLEDNKFARVIGGGNINYGIGGEPDYIRDLPSSEEPLANVRIDPSVGCKLPRGYHIRSLQREDYDNGYLYLKNVGVISREKWDERCEYLRARNDTYIVLVVTNSENWVVCSGTLMVERKFTYDLCLVGHVEDLLVADGQSGKNLGGRMLEALDQVSRDLGCYKILVRTTEANESFHEERGKFEIMDELSGYKTNRHALSQDSNAQASTCPTTTSCLAKPSAHEIRAATRARTVSITSLLFLKATTKSRLWLLRLRLLLWLPWFL